MLTLLARLGLRAGEVAALTLDDIDWRAGEISIAGKGGRRDRLPLPADAGQAIAAYLGTAGPRGAGPQRVHPEPGTAAGLTRARSPRPWAPQPRVLGWAPSTRTGSATPPPPPCSPAAGRLPRSARCSATPRR